MKLTQSEISALYVSLFGRASEGSGNKYWQGLASKENLTMADIANHMLKTEAASNFFGDSVKSDADFIAHIYATTLNKDANTDAEGKAFWVNALKGGVDRGTVVSELLKAAMNPEWSKSTDPATKAAHELIVNKVIASNIVADTVETIPQASDIKTALKAFVDINNNIKPESKAADIKANVATKKEELKISDEKLDSAATKHDKAKIIKSFYPDAKVEETPNVPEQPQTPEVPKPVPPKDEDKKPGTDGGSSGGGSSGGGSNSTEEQPATKVSNGEGYFYVYGDKLPAVKLEGINEVYYHKGKFYKEATKTNEIKVDKIKVVALKSNDNSKMLKYAEAKEFTKETLGELKDFDEAKLVATTKANDVLTLKIEGFSYQAFDYIDYVFEDDKGNVKRVGSNGYDYEKESGDSVKLPLEEAKKIKMMDAIKGEYNHPNVKAGDKLYTEHVEYRLGDGGAPEAITNKAENPAFNGLDMAIVMNNPALVDANDIKELGLHPNEVKHLKASIADKINANAIIIKKVEGTPLKEEDFTKLKTGFADKLADGGVKLASFSYDYLSALKDDASIIAKLKDGAVSLKEPGDLTIDSAKIADLKTNDLYKKLVDGELPKGTLTVAELKANAVVLPKFIDDSIEVSDIGSGLDVAANSEVVPHLFKLKGEIALNNIPLSTPFTGEGSEKIWAKVVDNGAAFAVTENVDYKFLTDKLAKVKDASLAKIKMTLDEFKAHVKDGDPLLAKLGANPVNIDNGEGVKLTKADVDALASHAQVAKIAKIGSLTLSATELKEVMEGALSTKVEDGAVTLSDEKVTLDAYNTNVKNHIAKVAEKSINFDKMAIGEINANVKTDLLAKTADNSIELTTPTEVITKDNLQTLNDNGATIKIKDDAFENVTDTVANVLTALALEGVGAKIKDGGVTLSDGTNVADTNILALAAHGVELKENAINGADVTTGKLAEVAEVLKEGGALHGKFTGDVVVKEVNGAVEATALNETFKLDTAQDGTLALTKFGATDKISFKAIDNGISNLHSEGDAIGDGSLTMANGTIYFLGALENTDAAQVFAGKVNGTHGFSATTGGAVKAILVGTKDEKSYLYSVDTADTTIIADELKLIGSVDHIIEKANLADVA